MTVLPPKGDYVRLCRTKFNVQLIEEGVCTNAYAATISSVLKCSQPALHLPYCHALLVFKLFTCCLLCQCVCCHHNIGHSSLLLVPSASVSKVADVMLAEVSSSLLSCQVVGIHHNCCLVSFISKVINDIGTFNCRHPLAPLFACCAHQLVHAYHHKVIHLKLLIGALAGEGRALLLGCWCGVSVAWACLSMVSACTWHTHNCFALVLNCGGCGNCCSF